MSLIFIILAIVAFILGVALLITGNPTGKVLWECLFVGLACFAASFLPFGNFNWGPRN